MASSKPRNRGLVRLQGRGTLGTTRLQHGPVQVLGGMDRASRLARDTLWRHSDQLGKGAAMGVSAGTGVSNRHKLITESCCKVTRDNFWAFLSCSLTLHLLVRQAKRLI